MRNLNLLMLVEVLALLLLMMQVAPEVVREEDQEVDLEEVLLVAPENLPMPLLENHQGLQILDQCKL